MIIPPILGQPNPVGRTKMEELLRETTWYIYQDGFGFLIPENQGQKYDTEDEF